MECYSRRRILNYILLRLHFEYKTGLNFFSSVTKKKPNRHRNQEIQLHLPEFFSIAHFGVFRPLSSLFFADVFPSFPTSLRLSHICGFVRACVLWLLTRISGLLCLVSCACLICVPLSWLSRELYSFPFRLGFHLSFDGDNWCVCGMSGKTVAFTNIRMQICIRCMYHRKC